MCLILVVCADENDGRVLLSEINVIIVMILIGLDWLPVMENLSADNTRLKLMQ
jgi:hypothetical protein